MAGPRRLDLYETPAEATDALRFLMQFFQPIAGAAPDYGRKVFRLAVRPAYEIYSDGSSKFVGVSVFITGW